MACRIALSGRPGPVVLEVLRDLPQRKVNDAVAAQALAPLVFPALALAPASDIRRAADLLTQAKRPMIIAGNGAYWGRGAAGLNTLAREFHIPVLGKALGRGLVPEDHEVGFSWPIAHHAAREADVVLLAGSRLGSVVCYGAPPFFREDVRFIQVNIDAAEIGRDRFIEAPVAGDCGPALEAIAAELARRSYTPRDPRWIGEAIAKTRARFDALGHEETGRVHPLRMARELAMRMPKDAIFVGDGANSLNWLKAVLRVRSSPGWMDHDPFGSMGVGLPLAIGAVAAQQESGSSRPVFLGSGDGAFGQYLGELATASLHGLPMFIMVANDGCWGASRNIEMRLLGRTFGVELNQSRYDLVAQGLECHGELAASPADVAPAFDRALAAVRDGKPALVNVLVDQKMGDQRADPQLQTMPFNHEWFFARQGN